MKEKLLLGVGEDGGLWFHRNSGERLEMHRHTELEMNLVLRGTGSYLLDDRKYPLARNTQVWLFPEQEHLLVECSPDFEMWILVIRPRLLQRLCVTPTTKILRETKPPGHFCKQLSTSEVRRLHGLLTEISLHKGEASRFNAGVAYAAMESWMAYVNASAVTVSSDVHPAVEKAVRWLRDESEPVPLEGIARRAGLSLSRLGHLFKVQTGVSLVAFRNRQRIERFLEFYGEGNRRTAMDAALAAGFGSYPQFHRIFQQVMGCSPAAYKRRLRRAEA